MSRNKKGVVPPITPGKNLRLYLEIGPQYSERLSKNIDRVWQHIHPDFHRVLNPLMRKIRKNNRD